MECSSCPGSGTCSGMFTANTMSTCIEALGMALPGTSTVPAVESGTRQYVAAPQQQVRSHTQALQDGYVASAELSAHTRSTAATCESWAVIPTFTTRTRTRTRKTHTRTHARTLNLFPSSLSLIAPFRLHCPWCSCCCSAAPSTALSLRTANGAQRRCRFSCATTSAPVIS